MEFLKKNYEKVVLGVVLLGLTVALALLPVMISSKRAKLDEIRDNLSHPKIKELPALDLTMHETVLQRVQTLVRFDFTQNHNVFNPVVWQKMPDGRPVKAGSGPVLGPEAMQVTDIKPLYLQLAFDSVSGNNYLISFTNETALVASKRTGQKLASRSGKNDLFGLVDVVGAPDKPDKILLNLNDSGDTIEVGPGKPFRRVEGYSADLKYPPQNNKAWRNQRVGATLTFADGQYIIVYISPTNVVLSSKQNEKKTTIDFNPSPATR